MVFKGDTLKDIVDEMVHEKKMTACAVVRRDGIPLASNFPTKSLSNEIFAMMSATILGAAFNMSSKSDLGVPSRVVIETPKAIILLYEAGPKVMMVCLLRKGESDSVDSKTIKKILDKVSNAI